MELVGLHDATMQADAAFVDEASGTRIAQPTLHALTADQPLQLIAHAPPRTVLIPSPSAIIRCCCPARCNAGCGRRGSAGAGARAA
jgi:hypothetical protein